MTSACSQSVHGELSAVRTQYCGYVKKNGYGSFFAFEASKSFVDNGVD